MGDGGKKEGVMETEDDGVSEKDQHAVEEERRLPDLAPPVKGGGEEEETAEEGNGSEERRHLGVLVAQEMGVGEWKAETAVGKKEVYGTEDKGRPTVLASREQPLSLPTAAVTTSTTITTTKRLRPTEMPRTQLGMPRHGHQLQARTISRSGRLRRVTATAADTTAAVAAAAVVAAAVSVAVTSATVAAVSVAGVVPAEAAATMESYLSIAGISGELAAKRLRARATTRATINKPRSETQVPHADPHTKEIWLLLLLLRGLLREWLPVAAATSAGAMVVMASV